MKFHSSRQAFDVEISFQAAALRDSMKEYLKAYRLTLDAMAKRGENTFEKVRLSCSRDVFKEKLDEQARQMAWLSATMFSREKQGDLYWLLQVSRKKKEDCAFIVKFWGARTRHNRKCNVVFSGCPVHTRRSFENRRMLRFRSRFLCRDLHQTVPFTDESLSPDVEFVGDTRSLQFTGTVTQLSVELCAVIESTIRVTFRAIIQSSVNLFCDSINR